MSHAAYPDCDAPVTTTALTLLFSDIEGSTRLLQDIDGGYADLLRDHRARVRAVVASRGGVEVDTQGDAFFVVFSDATDAVAAASEIQDRHVGSVIRVRVGLHSGEVQTLEEGGYVGLPIYEAARICAAAHGGQVLLSDATRGLVDVPVRELGEYRLKDISVPVRLFQLGTQDFGPPRAIGIARIPVPLTPLIGRQRDLSVVVGLVRDQRRRLVSLTGPGGTGKTRLAIEVAGELIDDFPDGVFFVDLSSASTVDAAWASIGRALGVSGSVEDRIGRGAVLVVLDNVEQILEIGTDLLTLLDLCPNCQIVSTSRIPLHIQDETEYPIEALERQDAVELFTARAQAISAGFEPDEAVVEICRRLDDLPLAIELAAARIRLLSTRELVERLERGLGVLGRGPRDGAQRQQTLEATIAWSHDLLTAEERDLFLGLGVFAGGWTLEACEVVCAASLDTLGALVDGNLVRHLPGRFAMLETIRTFANDRLADSGQAQSLRARHATYYLELAKRSRASGHGHAQFDLLVEETANTRAALAFLVEQPSTDAALELTLELWPSWIAQGRIAEGDRWMTHALARADRTNLTRWEDGLSIAGEFARYGGDFPRAMELKVEALALAEQLGNEPEIAATLKDMGDIELMLGDPAAARRLIEQAVGLRRTNGEPGGIAHAVFALGEVALAEDRLDEAVDHLQEVLSIARAEGMISDNTTDLGIGALIRLGEAHRRRGSLDLARRLITEGLEASLDFPLVYATRMGLEELASIFAAEGDVVRAAQLLGAAARGLRESGFVDDSARNRQPTETLVMDALGPDRYAAELEAGAQLPLREAAALALS